MAQTTAPAGTRLATAPQAPSAELRGRVAHLHFDRRARVWRTHEELDGERRSVRLSTSAATAGCE